MKTYIAVGKVGYFWDGPAYILGRYPWKWLATLKARLWLINWPYSRAGVFTKETLPKEAIKA